MHRYCFKIMIAMNVSAILAHLNLIKFNQMQRQQKWYKNLELDEKTTYLAEKAKYKASFKYQDKNRVKHKTDYWTKKEVMFPPAPLSADLGQKIVSDFCADTSP